ncbi:ABC transporter permease [Natrialbaceae archaeon A-CW1-1]
MSSHKKKQKLLSADSSGYRTPLKQVLYKFRRDKFALLGVLSFASIVLVVMIGPILSPYDPIRGDYSSLRLAPSLVHPMGTDHLGRDVMTRVMVGGRYSMQVGFGAILFASTFGTVFGAIAGYTKKEIVDELIMRSMDVLISIPAIILGIAVLGILGTEPFDFGFWTIGNIQKLVFVIGLVYMPRFARVTRGAVLKERGKDYVTLARLEGASHTRILISEIFPNITPPLLVLFSYRIGSAMIVAAALGFLGIGIQAPNPGWGVMLAQGREYLGAGDFWMIVFPGVALAATIISINVIGDGIRDALDPDVLENE